MELYSLEHYERCSRFPRISRKRGHICIWKEKLDFFSVISLIKQEVSPKLPCERLFFIVDNSNKKLVRILKNNKVLEVSSIASWEKLPCYELKTVWCCVEVLKSSIFFRKYCWWWNAHFISMSCSPVKLVCHSQVQLISSLV